MRILTLVTLTLASQLALGQGNQGGTVGSANDGQVQAFNLVLTPGQGAELKVNAEINDVLIVNASSNAFDPTAALLSPKGEKLIENDDVAEGNQSSQFLFRVTQPGEYKVLVTGFKGLAGGPFALQLKRFKAPLIQGTSEDAPFNNKNEPEWRAVRVQKGIPTTLSLYGSRNHTPGGYDSAGNRINNEIDAFNHGSGGRFTYTSDRDQELYIHIPRSGSDRFTIDALPVEFRTIALGAAASLDIPRSQTVSYRFKAQVGQIIRSKVGPGSSGFQVTIRAVKLDQEHQDHHLNELPSASKNSNTNTYFIRHSGEYEAVLSHSEYQTKSSQLEVFEYSNTFELKSLEKSLPIGENHYYKFDLPLGVLFELSAVSNLFDVNFTIYSPSGDVIAEMDDSENSTNPRYQMLVTQPGTYYLRIGSLGNGGGGSYELNKTITQPSMLKSGDTFTVNSEQPELRTMPCRTGEYFYLILEKDADVNLSLYRPDGSRVHFSQIQEPNGQILIMINPELTGNYLFVISSTSRSAKVKLSQATITKQ